MMPKKKTKGYTRSELEADRDIQKAFPPEGRVPSFTKTVVKGSSAGSTKASQTRKKKKKGPSKGSLKASQTRGKKK